MLISEAYRGQQAALHASSNYGVTGAKFAAPVVQVAIGVEGRSVLDYGAGKGGLREPLMREAQKAGIVLVYTAYEPAIEKWSAPPDPADVVACIDVLEHIEPDCLDAVLDDMRRCTLNGIFLTIHCFPAGKTLPDGRNAHLIQQPTHWWLPKLCERWEPRMLTWMGRGFQFAGLPA